MGATVQKLFAKPTVILAVALMAIIVMMILPVPAFILDIGLAASFALAILIFTVTLFVEKPLDFSAFPTILLASLMLRLSLNISSTKLIIGEGHTGTDAAGNVIQGFADFVMGGSVFLGLVVFCVLLIVNFVVITKGATRMAEVGARFALDGMPGKQLAIDSDMAAGAITHTEARARRERELQETTFFGSLDGASKFVKGDAVAGLLITLLNIVVGLIMGTVVHGMPIGAAFETYAILTVGDGLVTQIPAVIISIAAALLLARGGATGSTDLAITSQLGRHPAALATVGVLMVLFALVPGLPVVPFLTGGVILGGLAYWVSRRDDAAESDETKEKPSLTPRERPIGDVLDLDDIHVEFAPDLVDMVLDPASGLDSRITNMRTHIAKSFGIIMPEVRLTDDAMLRDGTYVLRVHGVEVARGVLHPDLMLALIPEDTKSIPSGTDVEEPVYGAPARWIQHSEREDAQLSGLTVVSPSEVLATHLLEVIKRNLGRLLTMKSLKRLLDELGTLSNPGRAEANRVLIEQTIPDKVPMDTLLQVLKLLLDEQVSVRNFQLILEGIAETRGQGHSADSICEHVRQRLGFQLVAAMRREDGTIPLVHLASDWEKRFAECEVLSDRGAPDVALPPKDFENLSRRIAEELARASKNGVFPALVTPGRRRRFLRSILTAKGISNPVMAFEEIGLDAKPALVGTITV
ncbi:flagellar biosynthesis protein FlhA [Marivita lacus]|uniref:Flagellar biosynthesis protein FlhA n=1 Tax=Marivita lacus TaxID=1323742 RepID=A0ABQ1KAK4_9RHOB|nr:flagellar biosynthesis protein FlhA [Marivita lacus]GGB93397.1 flagellar biosynthesis protein FlhA [Marivita lacus]